MEAYVNADIYVYDTVLFDHAVLVDGGLLAGILPLNDVPSSARVVDAGGRNICAGFVDLQVNGGDGVLFNADQSRSSLEAALRAHQKLGSTSIFPTVFTSDISSMKAMLDTCLECRSAGVLGIAGIHFEGPVIEGSKAGVHDVDKIRGLDDAILELYMRAASELPTVVTLAPEKVNDSQIQELREGGVIVLAGHTDADFDRMRAALSSGLQGATHLFNAMSAFTSRAPGTVGAILADDKAYASIIVDGFHVHWASVRAAWRAMTRGHLFAVTDAMPCVGSDLTEFDLDTLHVHVRNGRCETSEGTLAGSALDLATAVRNLVQKVGIPLPEAIRMATAYPCEFAGLQGIGRLQAGWRADFLLFDNQLHDRTVFVGGERIN